MSAGWMWSLCAALLAATSASTFAADGIERVSWLQGCWEQASPSRVVEEIWTRPRGGVMLGLGRTTRDGRLVEHESIVIREAGSDLLYEASPSGQPSATFRSIEVGAARVVFANPDHDFPQRIGYESGTGELRAWVEGAVNGQSRRFDFTYRRIACP